jgi:hypothetical protein
VRACFNIEFRTIERSGLELRGLDNEEIGFCNWVLALGFAAATAARADFAVVKFKDTGACRAWYDHTAKSWGHTQVLWVMTSSWEVAQTKGAYAMKHHWCKAWYK